MVKRHALASEMDMINLAVFGMTAGQWRKQFKPKNARDNMRNYATPEELEFVWELPFGLQMTGSGASLCHFRAP
jgi:hypothetical protein